MRNWFRGNFSLTQGLLTRAVPELDGLSRQPILGVHMLSMTHREVAIFDDACTVPTPCLLLPDEGKRTNQGSCIFYITEKPVCQNA